jgi:hypothetical protein
MTGVFISWAGLDRRNSSPADKLRIGVWQRFKETGRAQHELDDDLVNSAVVTVMVTSCAKSDRWSLVRYVVLILRSV